VVGSEDEAPPDHVIDFVIGHGQSLDWLQRGDATPMIRMLRAALRSVGSRAQGRRQGDGLNCEATKAKRPDTDVERTVGASIHRVDWDV